MQAPSQQHNFCVKAFHSEGFFMSIQYDRGGLLIRATNASETVRLIKVRSGTMYKQGTQLIPELTAEYKQAGG
jgi:hypothetical protein